MARTPKAPPKAAPKTAAKATSRASGSVRSSTVRVDVDLLDTLMNLVGELVVTRNQVCQHAEGADNPKLLAASRRLDGLTTELRERVMATRMRPVRKLFDKVPRIVRDVARAEHKEAEVELSGGEVELDRTVIEALADPLTHLIRNCVGHGVEGPEERLAHGKPRAGKLTLRATQRSGTVTITISDDGRGIDVDKVLAAALDGGLISTEEALAMPADEAVALIFRPALSTADEVTSISGRGVGMDVVRTKIEEIGGSVEVTSEPGRGTRFTIEVPLTLAIIPALVVRVGSERFAIPQGTVVELVRAAPEEGRPGIERLHGAPIYRLRGRLLPLVFMDQSLGLDEDGGADLGEPASPDLSRARNIVVVRVDKRLIGLVVDGVQDGVEIVVKPLAPALRESRLFAGATILGDGRVVLILDVVGIAQRARLSGAEERQVAARGRDEAPGERRRAEDGLLLVDGEGGSRVAIPLRAIARLEHVDAARFERVGRHELVQYHGALLPVVRLDELLPGADPAPRRIGGPVHLVVLEHDGVTVGLRVQRILDMVTTAIPEPREPRRSGALGTLVVAGTATELIDLDALIARVPAAQGAPRRIQRAVG